MRMSVASNSDSPGVGADWHSAQSPATPFSDPRYGGQSFLQPPLGSTCCTCDQPILVNEVRLVCPDGRAQCITCAQGGANNHLADMIMANATGQEPPWDQGSSGPAGDLGGWDQDADHEGAAADTSQLTEAARDAKERRERDSSVVHAMVEYVSSVHDHDSSWHADNDSLRRAGEDPHAVDDLDDYSEGDSEIALRAREALRAMTEHQRSNMHQRLDEESALDEFVEVLKYQLRPRLAGEPLSEWRPADVSRDVWKMGLLQSKAITLEQARELSRLPLQRTSAPPVRRKTKAGPAARPARRYSAARPATAAAAREERFMSTLSALASRAAVPQQQAPSGADLDVQVECCLCQDSFGVPIAEDALCPGIAWVCTECANTNAASSASVRLIKTYSFVELD
jgi:hypothetical protein